MRKSGVLYIIILVELVLQFSACMNPAGGNNAVPVEQYTVAFKNGSEILKTVTVEKGSTISVSQFPVVENGPTGKIFFWNTAETGREENFSSSFAIQQNLTIYAIWAWEINSETDLKKIGTPSFPMDDIYMLGMDITLTTSPWAALGTNSLPFSGLLDGNGHTINNLSITGNVQYAGLFGYTDNAEIRNLDLHNISIDVSGANVEYIGGLAAYSKNTEFKGIHAAGSIKASHTADGRLYTGGIIGNATNDAGLQICFRDCNSAVTVSAKASSNMTDVSTFTGGLIGYYKNGLIEQCGSSGQVSVTLEPANGSPILMTAGGLLGSAYNTNINKCYATGPVSSDLAGGYAYLGGLIGNSNYEESDQYFSISNSYATGNVSSSSTNNAVFNSEALGGLVGSINKTNITKCYATGNILSRGHAGGLLGQYYTQNPLPIFNSAALSNNVATTKTNDYAGRVTGVLPSEQNKDPIPGIIANKGMTVNGAIVADTTKQGAGLTLTELQNRLTYTNLGWDFTNIWEMRAGNYPYPVLKWQTGVPSLTP